MHRCSSIVTMPFARFHVACVGQTRTHGGLSQWLHRTSAGRPRYRSASDSGSSTGERALERFLPDPLHLVRRARGWRARCARGGRRRCTRGSRPSRRQRPDVDRRSPGGCASGPHRARQPSARAGRRGGRRSRRPCEGTGAGRSRATSAANCEQLDDLPSQPGTASAVGSTWQFQQVGVTLRVVVAAVAELRLVRVAGADARAGEAHLHVSAGRRPVGARTCPHDRLAPVVEQHHVRRAHVVGGRHALGRRSPGARAPAPPGGGAARVRHAGQVTRPRHSARPARISVRSRIAASVGPAGTGPAPGQASGSPRRSVVRGFSPFITSAFPSSSWTPATSTPGTQYSSSGGSVALSIAQMHASSWCRAAGGRRSPPSPAGGRRASASRSSRRCRGRRRCRSRTSARGSCSPASRGTRLSTLVRISRGSS